MQVQVSAQVVRGNRGRQFVALRGLDFAAILA